MCWNSEVSLNTFLFSFSVLILIYINRNGKYKLEHFHSKYVYLYFFSIIIMQLLEFFLWKNIDKKKMNRLLSIIGLIIILSQPFFSILALEDNNKNKNKYLLFYLFFVLYIILFEFKKINFNTSVKNGHLQWNWLSPNIISFIIYLYFLLISVRKFNKFSVILLLLISLYNYYNDKTWGSMWCFWANIVFLFYAINILIIKPFKEYNKLC